MEKQLFVKVPKLRDINKMYYLRVTYPMESGLIGLTSLYSTQFRLSPETYDTMIELLTQQNIDFNLEVLFFAHLSISLIVNLDYNNYYAFVSNIEILEQGYKSVLRFELINMFEGA